MRVSGHCTLTHDNPFMYAHAIWYIHVNGDTLTHTLQQFLVYDTNATETKVLKITDHPGLETKIIDTLKGEERVKDMKVTKIKPIRMFPPYIS